MHIYSVKNLEQYYKYCYFIKTYTSFIYVYNFEMPRRKIIREALLNFQQSSDVWTSRKSKNLGSNPNAVESVFFSTERFQIL